MIKLCSRHCSKHFIWWLFIILWTWIATGPLTAALPFYYFSLVYSYVCRKLFRTCRAFLNIPTPHLYSVDELISLRKKKLWEELSPPVHTDLYLYSCPLPPLLLPWIYHPHPWRMYHPHPSLLLRYWIPSILSHILEELPPSVNSFRLPRASSIVPFPLPFPSAYKSAIVSPIFGKKSQKTLVTPYPMVVFALSLCCPWWNKTLDGLFCTCWFQVPSFLSLLNLRQ